MSRATLWRRKILYRELRYFFPRVLGLFFLIVSLYLIASWPKNSLATNKVSPDVFGVATESASSSIGDTEITSAEVVPGIKTPILMYHYIENPGHDPTRDKLLVTPANLDAQINYLIDSGWTTVSLDDLSAALSGQKTLPPKPIILTFDDGYLDFYYQAWPIIQKYGVKATIYVMSRQESCSGDQSIYMTRDMIRELSMSPLITVASHTLNHCDLKSQNPTEQAHEIIDSKKELQDLIGKPVRHFAYPYGDFNVTSLSLVRQAGYETASSTITGSTNSDITRYSLHRVRIGNFSLSQFELVLAK